MQGKTRTVKVAIKEPNLKDPELSRLVKLLLTALANEWRETAFIALGQIERLLSCDKQKDSHGEKPEGDHDS